MDDDSDRRVMADPASSGSFGNGDARASSDRYTPRHAVETPPVPYFACPCGTTIGINRDAFPLAGLFDVEPDLAWLPDDALDGRGRVVTTFSAVLRNPNDECSMHRWLSLIGGNTADMCSGPVMYEARVLGAPDWSLRYHLCIACAAEFRREGKHEIRSRAVESGFCCESLRQYGTCTCPDREQIVGR